MDSHSNTAMTTNDGDNDILRQSKVSEFLGDKGRSANNIESSDAEEAEEHFNNRGDRQGGFRYRLGSKTPCFLKTSATMGTVELTGLEITRTKALGAVVAMPVARSRTIPALI